MLQNKLHVFCCPFFRTFRARQDKGPAPTDTDFYKNMNTSLLDYSFTAECSRFVQYGFTTLIIRDQSEYSKKILSALWGSVWSKNKRGRPPPPGLSPISATVLFSAWFARAMQHHLANLHTLHVHCVQNTKNQEKVRFNHPNRVLQNIMVFSALANKLV